MSMSASVNSRGSSKGAGGSGGAGGIMDYVDLQELSKGWKAAVARVQDPATRHEARVKNDRGNLPLHTACSFRAPLDMAEALLEVYPEAARETNNYGNLALHFTAWKKGPLDVEKLLLSVFPEGAAQKNNHGNLPLHYAAHYNAPLEVVEALYRAYPEGASQRNNDNNTPLDLAIADGASQDVIALLQGKTVAPSEDEAIALAKARVERAEKALQGVMERHDGAREDLAEVLDLLMAVRVGYPQALYSAGMDPSKVPEDSLEALLVQAREAEMNAQEDMEMNGEVDNLENIISPIDDVVEQALMKFTGLDAVKSQIRGMRRTIEYNKVQKSLGHQVVSPLEPHLAFVGGPGTGKSSVARIIGRDILHRIGAVPQDKFVEVGREELIGKTMGRTHQKTRAVIDRARGGVLFIDEAYTLLPSSARKSDHGLTALSEIGKILPRGDPFVILAGYTRDLQKLLAADLGYKGSFLVQIEFPDYTVDELATIFFDKAEMKGLTIDPQVTKEFVAKAIEDITDTDWRTERNGRVSDILLYAVRLELKRRSDTSEGSGSGGNDIPNRITSPKKLPSRTPEEVTVTAADIQNALRKL